MSTAAEMARTEAEQAESEEPDEEEAEEAAEIEREQEQAPEPEPEQPTEAQYEAAFKSLEREAQRHEREVMKRAGPLANDLKPCPLCVTPGFVIPMAPGTFDADRRNAVLIAMGEPTDTDYEIAEDAEPCDKCRALGQVVTGSKVPGQFTKLCAKCNGSGWTPKVMTPERLYAMPSPPPLPVPGMAPGGYQPVGQATTEPYPGYGIPFVPVPNGVEDGWHRPAGHPHWGLDPETVGVSSGS